jgi:hypothetical protein
MPTDLCSLVVNLSWAGCAVVYAFAASRFPGELVAIIPRHPLLRTAGHQLAVFLQRGQVEGIGIAELAGVDEAHEQVANVGAVLGLIEERVLVVENRFRTEKRGWLPVLRYRFALYRGF